MVRVKVLGLGISVMDLELRVRGGMPASVDQEIPQAPMLLL